MNVRSEASANSVAVEKPMSVVGLSVLEILTGLSFAFGGTILIVSNALGSELFYFATIHFPLAAAFLALAPASLNAKNWAWLLGLVVSVVSMADDVVALAFTPLPIAGKIGTAFVLVTALLIIYFLSRKDVKSFLK